MSVISLRPTAEQMAKINEQYLIEKNRSPGLKQSDFLRSLIDIGLYVKENQNQSKADAEALTPKEEEMFLMLYQLTSELGYMVKNSFNEGRTKFKTPYELHDSAKTVSQEKVAMLKQKLG